MYKLLPNQKGSPYELHLKSICISNEEILIRGMRIHDKASFLKLYQMYSANLLSLLLVMVKQRETAEDLLQECFIKILNNFNQYDEKKSRLFTWLLKVTRNTAIDHIRKSSTRKEKNTFDLDDSINELEMRKQIHFNIDTIGIKKLVDYLPAKHQILINLIYFQGFTHTEVAKALNLPLGSVKTGLRSAVFTLRKNFAPHELLNWSA